jgi:hypothetical protein
MKKGTTRLVFIIFNKYVIKIPNFTYSHLNFLNGCYCNWSERNFYRSFKELPEFSSKVAPSLYCFPFGLFQIQYYCEPLNRELTDEELEYFEHVRNGETKHLNFGIYNGIVVCFDYAK